MYLELLDKSGVSQLATSSENLVTSAQFLVTLVTSKPQFFKPCIFSTQAC